MNTEQLSFLLDCTRRPKSDGSDRSNNDISPRTRKRSSIRLSLGVLEQLTRYEPKQLIAATKTVIAIFLVYQRRLALVSFVSRFRLKLQQEHAAVAIQRRFRRYLHLRNMYLMRRVLRWERVEEQNYWGRRNSPLPLIGMGSSLATAHLIPATKPPRAPHSSRLTAPVSKDLNGGAKPRLRVRAASEPRIRTRSSPKHNPIPTVTSCPSEEKSKSRSSGTTTLSRGYPSDPGFTYEAELEEPEGVPMWELFRGRRIPTKVKHAIALCRYQELISTFSIVWRRYYQTASTRSWVVTPLRISPEMFFQVPQSSKPRWLSLVKANTELDSQIRPQHKRLLNCADNLIKYIRSMNHWLGKLPVLNQFKPRASFALRMFKDKSHQDMLRRFSGGLQSLAQGNAPSSSGRRRSSASSLESIEKIDSQILIPTVSTPRFAARAGSRTHSITSQASATSLGGDNTGALSTVSTVPSSVSDDDPSQAMPELSLPAAQWELAVDEQPALDNLKLPVIPRRRSVLRGHRVSLLSSPEETPPLNGLNGGVQSICKRVNLLPPLNTSMLSAPLFYSFPPLRPVSPLKLPPSLEEESAVDSSETSESKFLL